MRAVRYPGYGLRPELVELPEPSCPDDGVLVRVEATGVCRSDWHAWRGHDPVPLPMVPGHEFAGTVHAVGSRVRGWQVGDRVTAPFVQGCGRCGWCRDGQAQVCPDQVQPGFTTDGSFAELVVVTAAATNLVRLPDDVDAVAAAALGCRVATAHRALTVHGRLAAGEWLVVHGCGGVGLSAVMIARALGARVVAVDVAEGPRRRASELGAETVLAPGPDLVERVHELTGGGAHVSVDAVGVPATVAASVHCLRRRGRHVQVGLLLGEDGTPPVPMGPVVAQELSLHGSHGMPAVDYPALLELVASGRLRPGELVGRVVQLSGAPDALVGLDGEPTTAGITVISLG
ncbi:zinc-dependent alcohol dehydrogenase family protein [Auraticoccus monumenti]|uniref:Alcohol dehydrogenase n=1 Tax=Auraticoccus monumenti TaxID=675864 RepID=A0A1G6SV29_9ACTN|nr:zinc-dependent alcohol dehydrogenase family protein [Auraticoccus monumenti]SDD20156.1 alcohol dehydrogenase [Auraticoccus monumenti]